MITQTAKQCTRCGVTKTLDEFPRRKASRDGRNSHCKVCEYERVVRWRQENPEKYREGNRRWYQENSEKVREKVRRWAKENPERAREASRRWAEENPEKIREIQRRSYHANPEKAIERSRRWQQANPERMRQAQYRWTDRNPEKTRAYSIVGYHIRMGKLQTASDHFCFVCGTSSDHDARMEYHHVDYSKPLEVFPLCSQCHADWHKGN